MTDVNDQPPPSPAPRLPVTSTKEIIGTIIFVSTLAAWLIAESRDIDTAALLAFAVPVVGALFLSSGISRAGDAAQQAAAQTNGALDSRIKAAVAAALADRDAARTRQTLGDIATPPAKPTRGRQTPGD